MNKGLLISILMLMILPAAAQSPAAPRDLTGVWDGRLGEDISRDLAPGQQLVLTPYGADRFKKVNRANDPSARCLQFGPARALMLGRPFMIVQHPHAIAILTEPQLTFRLIYTDGRPQPPDISDFPEWMGSSIGRWEGSTLVVDTIAVDEATWLDNVGHEHSDKLHVVERFQKTEPDTIKWDVTYEDPVFFSKPFTTTRTIRRSHDHIKSNACTAERKGAIQLPSAK